MSVSSDKDIKTIGKNVKNLRKNAGLTQEALAFDAGIQTYQLSHIERGLCDAKISTYSKLASALSTSLPALMGENGRGYWITGWEGATGKRRSRMR